MAKTDMTYYIYSEEKDAYYSVETYSFVGREDATGFKHKWLRDLVLGYVKNKKDKSAREANVMGIFDLSLSLDAGINLGRKEINGSE